MRNEGNEQPLAPKTELLFLVTVRVGGQSPPEDGMRLQIEARMG